MSKPSGNFLVHCVKISILDESCIIGSSVLIISIILLVLNIYAFSKMTKFYKKMNFENTIILLSIIQTILLQLVLISSYDIFFESFFLVQIFIISLIIRKFIILAREPKTFYDKNGIFLLLNLLNIIIFFIYPIYLNIFKGHHLYVKLFYRIFHAIATFILSYYCCYFIKLTVKYKENYLNSYYFFYEAQISNNELDDVNIENNNISNDNIKANKESSENDKNTNNNENNNTDNNNNINNNANNKENNNSHNNTNNDNNDKRIIKRKKKGEVFYHKKKKQIRYLYLVNLFCALTEIGFTVIRNFILHNHYLDDDYRTIPNSIDGDLIYYFYLIVCFCNVSVNYLCFFFYIRHQYTRNSKKFLKSPEKKILDEKFIEKEVNIKDSNNPEVDAFLFSSAARNKEEEPVAVEVKADERDSLNPWDFDAGNNEDALLPKENQNEDLD